MGPLEAAKSVKVDDHICWQPGGEASINNNGVDGRAKCCDQVLDTSILGNCLVRCLNFVAPAGMVEASEKSKGNGEGGHVDEDWDHCCEVFDAKEGVEEEIVWDVVEERQIRQVDVCR